MVQPFENMYGSIANCTQLPIVHKYSSTYSVPWDRRHLGGQIYDGVSLCSDVQKWYNMLQYVIKPSLLNYCRWDMSTETHRIGETSQ